MPPTTGQIRLQSPEDWHLLVASLGLRAAAAELATNCELASWDGARLRLNLDPAGEHMQIPSAVERLRGALAGALGMPVTLEIRVGKSEQETPARRRVREDAERQAEAESQLRADPVALRLQERFGAEWVPDSIRPLD
jgi:DNA polymerase-3 subunit gamma/tau